MKKNALKALVAALIASISTSLAADVQTIYHSYGLNGCPISVWGQIECVSFACSTNPTDYKLSFVQQFSAKNTTVTNVVSIISQTPATQVTNVIPSTPIFVKPGDYFICGGFDATNGNANATIFIKR